MRTFVILFVALMIGPAGHAVEFSFDEKPRELVLLGDGKPWLSTQFEPLDLKRREQTYKVFTHVYDFAGEAAITKGPGGKYSHHRGMFIGWNDTLAGDEDYDTWHMSNCYQEHVEWVEMKAGKDKAVQREKVRWYTSKSEPFIEELRTISATPGPDGSRIFDFQSTLTSLSGTIKLRGDLQHAGMQIRMANEVAQHQESTNYILPEGAKELDNDEVVGAWWVCGSPVVRDKRYWIIHMTPQDHPTGRPVYSIRRYARFGAFFEPDLEEGRPLTLKFRILVSHKELSPERCAAMYEDYSKSK